jgi:hypothetical protein
VDKRIPLVIRQVAYNLRGGFLVRPLIITLTLGCVGALLSFLEKLVPGFSDFVPAVLFPTHSDPQVAQVILGGIAASIMTVVSIVFAILLMMLTLASMQFSPRIIVSFSRDRVTQMDARDLPWHIFLLHGSPARGAIAATAIRAGRHRHGGNAAGAGMRWLAAVLHPSHLADDQRQLYRRPDCFGKS